MAGLARYLLAPRLTPLAASLCLLAFVWIWWIIIRRVPVDSPNKPIRRPEKIRRLRRQSFVYAGVCTLACAGTAAAYWLRPLPTTALSVYASLILALCWQSFTLSLIHIWCLGNQAAAYEQVSRAFLPSARICRAAASMSRPATPCPRRESSTKVWRCLLYTSRCV